MRKALVAIGLAFPLPVAAQDVVIAALGDSLTQGYGLPAQEGFVPQLQNWLAQQGAAVRLVNAGVSGDTTAGGLSRAAWTLTPEVDGLIVALGGNDLLRGIDPATSRENLAGILAIAAEAEVEVLLVGMQAPGNFGAAYKAEFDAIYPELAAQYGAGYAPDFFAGLAEEGRDPAELRAWFQADGIHPNSAGVARVVAALGPQVLELAQQARQEPE
ncbi:MAG: arylesterase [Sulfitobacter sp.]